MTEEPLTRHARRRMETRRRLVNAAIDLVLEKGYDAITIQEIADRADLGYGTFYLHFKDKEDVVWAAIQDGVTTVQARVARQFTGTVPPKVEYYGYLNIFRHIEANRDLYRIMLGGKGSSVLSNRIQALLAEDIIGHMKTSPAVLLNSYNLPPEVVAQVLTGAIARLALWWAEVPNEYTPDQMAAMLFQLLHHQQPPLGNA